MMVTIRSGPHNPKEAMDLEDFMAAARHASRRGHERCIKELMIIQLLFVLVVIGVGLWLVQSISQIDASLKKVIQAVLIIVALFLTLKAFGLMGAPPGKTLW